MGALERGSDDVILSRDLTLLELQEADVEAVEADARGHDGGHERRGACLEGRGRDKYSAGLEREVAHARRPQARARLCPLER
jgi:hypothetical protein